jgi:hypothetical protein
MLGRTKREGTKKVRKEEMQNEGGRKKKRMKEMKKNEEGKEG